MQQQKLEQYMPPMDLEDILRFHRSIKLLEEPSFFDTNFLTPSVTSHVKEHGKRLVTWKLLQAVQGRRARFTKQLHEGRCHHRIVAEREAFAHLYMDLRDLISHAYTSLAHLIATTEHIFITEEVKDEFTRYVSNVGNILQAAEKPASRERISFELEQVCKIHAALEEADNSHRVLIGKEHPVDYVLQHALEDLAEETKSKVSTTDIALVRRALLRAVETEQEHVIYTHDKSLYTFITQLDRARTYHHILEPRHDHHPFTLVKTFWTSWSFDYRSYRRSSQATGMITLPASKVYQKK